MCFKLSNCRSTCTKTYVNGGVIVKSDSAAHGRAAQSSSVKILEKPLEIGLLSRAARHGFVLFPVFQRFP
jgi:hypothetical protein